MILRSILLKLRPLLEQVKSPDSSFLQLHFHSTTQYNTLYAQFIALFLLSRRNFYVHNHIMLEQHVQNRQPTRLATRSPTLQNCTAIFL